MPKKTEIVSEPDNINEWVKSQEERLRKDGWMTVDEFMSRITPAMTEYLHGIWKDPALVHHPEDVGSHALSFMEGIYQGLKNFGASPIRKEDDK